MLFYHVLVFLVVVDMLLLLSFAVCCKFSCFFPGLNFLIFFPSTRSGDIGRSEALVGTIAHEVVERALIARAFDAPALHASLETVARDMCEVRGGRRDIGLWLGVR